MCNALGFSWSMFWFCEIKFICIAVALCDLVHYVEIIFQIFSELSNAWKTAN